MHSNYRDLGQATLPIWQGRQYYMHSFEVSRPIMAEGYEDYGPIVSDLCSLAGLRNGEAHMTVDEKIIQPGWSQRRPGAHVDGCFLPVESRWGHPAPGWAHYCNNIPYDRMAIIVAASVPGCVVYPGQFEGEPKSDGDLEHIRSQLGLGQLLPASRGFLLSPDCVHESLQFPKATKRTFLRIAFSP